LFTAPYDFRQGPDAFQVQFDALQLLIETASAANGNKPVVLVSLSMGCPYTHLFLTSHVSQVSNRLPITLIYVYSPLTQLTCSLLSIGLEGSLRQQLRFLLWSVCWFIRCFVHYLEVRLVGNPSTVLSSIKLDHISGGNAGAKNPKINNEIRSLARTWGSVNWLVPPVAFWGDQVFVSTPQKNYTMKDVQELYPLFGAYDSLEIYEGVFNYTTIQDPGVKVYCYYGFNTSTLFTLTYESTDFQSSQPVMTFVDGDDTAAVASLALCSNWSNVTVIPVENMQHAGIV